MTIDEIVLALLRIPFGIPGQARTRAKREPRPEGANDDDFRMKRINRQTAAKKAALQVPLGHVALRHRPISALAARLSPPESHLRLMSLRLLGEK